MYTIERDRCGIKDQLADHVATIEALNMKLSNYKEDVTKLKNSIKENEDHVKMKILKFKTT